MLQAELRVLSGKQAGSTLPLPVGKFLVGREEDCHLRPNSDLVSRHHCVFTLDEYGLRLRDLGSTNGSFINGEQIRGAVVLNMGDTVSFGKLDFQVIIGDPITDETRTNLSNDLPTEVFSTGDAPAASESGEFATNDPEDDSNDTQFTPEEPATSDTMMNIPVQPPQPAAEGQSEMPPQPGGAPQPGMEGQQFPPTGDTQFYPQQGMPQMPVGYPPQMGYPQGMMPYGYPGYPQMGYPQQHMGYPPGMYPPQQGQEAPPAQQDAKPSVEEPAVRLPDPSQTGVKAPEPAPPASEGEATGEKKDERTTDQKSKEEAPSAAADAIQQYLQRRPKSGN